MFPTARQRTGSYCARRTPSLAAETHAVAESSAPDYIDLPRHRDWEKRRVETWLPRLGLALACALPVVALFNIFGQAPSQKSAADPNGAASLEVSAPTKVRGGLLYEARFDIRANREIKDAVLVLDGGWAESMTINTIEPSPSKETSDNGRLALDLGDIPAGKLWRQYLQFQVNPVNLGSQAQGVDLYDGDVQLLHIERRVTVWP
jgi:hypothetical protein